MFTKFSAARPNDARETGRKSLPPKRKQVARACDWCRLNRIKCDEFRPCRNCEAKGSKCSNAARTTGSRTLTTANREIERLGQRIKALEAEAEAQKSSIVPAPDNQVANDISIDRTQWPSPTTISPQPKTSSPTPTHPPQALTGVWLPDATRPNRFHYYGPSSAAFFLTRVQAHLTEAFQRLGMGAVPFRDPMAAALDHASPVIVPEGLMSGSNSHQQAPQSGNDMARHQEEFYLHLYWSSFHNLIPILNQASFNAFYHGLWAQGSTSRKASALVDVMLALCLQYSAAFVSVAPPSPTFGSEDLHHAGSWWFDRARDTISQEQDCPSLEGMEARILSVIYLLNTSSLNRAYTSITEAVSAARSLGIDREQVSPNLEQGSLDKCTLLWQSLQMLDTYVGLELGRPYHTPLGTRPVHGISPLHLQVDPQSLYGEPTVTEFHACCLDLFQIMRTIHTDFDIFCSGIFGTTKADDIHNDPELLEKSAVFLKTILDPVKEWTQRVPEPLKVQRKGSGAPFSTLRSPLQLDSDKPIWLQRQQLLLELTYHDQMMKLHRPFIRLRTPFYAWKEASAAHSIAALNHASFITHLIHQVLGESDVLNLFGTIYRFQWEAMLTTVGFALAHIFCPHTSTAKDAILKSITTFQILAQNNISAGNAAAELARSLLDQSTMIVQKFRASSLQGTSAPEPPGNIMVETTDKQNPRGDFDFDFGDSSLGDSTRPSSEYSTDKSQYDHNFMPIMSLPDMDTGLADETLDKDCLMSLDSFLGMQLCHCPESDCLAMNHWSEMNDGVHATAMVQ